MKQGSYEHIKSLTRDERDDLWAELIKTMYRGSEANDSACDEMIEYIKIANFSEYKL